MQPVDQIITTTTARRHASMYSPPPALGGYCIRWYAREDGLEPSPSGSKVGKLPDVLPGLRQRRYS